MECLRSSHSASSTSCSLRMKVRSCVRNRFLASCWVSVEPPCETPRCRTLATAARAMPIGIDAVMRIEPAVLDGDEGLRQMRRQILQRNIGAGHFAARRQHAAVEADDLDGRRPLRDFQRLDRRQMRADPDHDADCRDHGPEAEHRAPVDQAAEAAAGARLGLALAARPASRAACARAAHRRRNRWPCALRMAFSSARRRRWPRGPAGRGAARSAMRRARIAAPCVRRSFSVPTPYANAAHTGPAAR